MNSVPSPPVGNVLRRLEASNVAVGPPLWCNGMTG
jgi:hypothetical protein